MLDKVEERVFLLLGNSPTWVGTLTAQFFVTKLSIEEYYPLVYYTSSVEHRASFVSPVLAVYKLCNRKKNMARKKEPHIWPLFCASFTSRDTRQKFGIIYVHSLSEMKILFSAPVSIWPESFVCDA